MTKPILKCANCNGPAGKQQIGFLDEFPVCNKCIMAVRKYDEIERKQRNNSKSSADENRSTRHDNFMG